jgi:hypothetical protein
MKTIKLSLCVALVTVLLFAGSPERARASSPSPLADEIILIVRHAEKQPDGPGLTPTGQQRANLYVKYFENFQVDSQTRRPDYLYAAADSAKTSRCRLTITPLSRAVNIPIDTTFKNKHVDDLAQTIETHPAGKTILICWHHEQIGNLLQDLGANPLNFIPGNNWPEDRYNWLIELRYDHSGNLEQSQSKLIVEYVLPGDKN